MSEEQVIPKINSDLAEVAELNGAEPEAESVEESVEEAPKKRGRKPKVAEEEEEEVEAAEVEE